MTMCLQGGDYALGLERDLFFLQSADGFETHAHRDAMLSGPSFFFDSSGRWGKGRESEAVDKRLSKLKW